MRTAFLLGNTAFIFLVIVTACTPSKNIYHVAKKKYLAVHTVGGIKLSGGVTRIDSLPPSSKDEPIYLLFDGNNLKYISTSKRVANGEFMYLVEKPGDSIYQLTRSSWFPRYFYEDTVLFHSNYIVSARSLYDDVTGKRTLVKTELYHYYFTADSLIELSFDSFDPLPSIYEYGRNIPFTGNPVKQSRQRKMPKYREEDLLKHIAP